MKELLEYLLENLLGKGNYELAEDREGDRVSYTVKTAPENMGLLIGKEGRMIKSIRNILKVRATLEKTVVTLNVGE